MSHEFHYHGIFQSTIVLPSATITVSRYSISFESGIMSKNVQRTILQNLKRH